MDLHTSSEQTHTTPSFSKPPVSQPLHRGFPKGIMILIMSLFLILFSVGGFLLGSRFGSNANDIVPVPSADPDMKPTGTDDGIACTADALECPDGSFVGRVPPSCEFAKCPDSSENFIKRNYNTNGKFFHDKPYPQEILSLTDNDLVGINCSLYYSGYQGETFTAIYQSAPEATELTDQLLLSLRKQLDTPPSQPINAIQACTTENKKRIIAYERWSGGGGMGNTAFFGLVDSKNIISEKVKLLNDGTPYFGCRTPLVLTKTNILYYMCGGGDGGFAKQSIYAINLSTGALRSVIECTASQAEESKATTVTCK